MKNKGPKSSEKIFRDQIKKIKYLEGLKIYLSQDIITIKDNDDRLN